MASVFLTLDIVTQDTRVCYLLVLQGGHLKLVSLLACETSLNYLTHLVLEFSEWEGFMCAHFTSVCPALTESQCA